MTQPPRKRACLAAAVMAAAVVGAPVRALAFDPLTFGNFELTVEGGLDASAVRDSGDMTTSGSLDLTLAYRVTRGPLTFGASVAGGMHHDSTATRRFAVNDDPYLDPGFWIEGDAFGYLAVSDSSSAIGEHCVEAPATGDNFGHADHISISTCPAFDTRSVLYYRTPDLGRGVKVAVSVMPDTGFESVGDGEAATALSAALIVDRQTPDGITWTGSLGVEAVQRVAGGGPTPFAVQAGLNMDRDGWQMGGAIALTDNGNGTDDLAFGLGLRRDLTPRLSASIGLNAARSHADGIRKDEASLAVIAMYSFVPDKLSVEAGLWQVRATSEASRTIVGLGLSASF
jgi:hypothetical protein